jgi:DNA polymerase (family 10)
MSKQRYSRHTALTAAREVLAELVPACEEGRVVVAGSLRRRKEWVGDVEIVYVSRMEERPVDMFKTQPVAVAAEAIARLEKAGVLAKRQGVNGQTSYGNQNKLMVHVRTGVPVDLFATCETSWFNYLVCRTGPAELNTRIATLAKAKGWSWAPYGSGFNSEDGSKHHPVNKEADVFEFVGLEFLEPKDRR